ENYIQQKITDLKNMETYSVELKIKLSQRSGLNDRLAYSQYKKRSTPEVTLSMVQEKEDQYKQWQIKEGLTKKLQYLPRFKSAPVKYTEEDIENTRVLEYRRDQMLSLAIELGIPYSANIDEYVQYWKDMLDWL